MKQCQGCLCNETHTRERVWEGICLDTYCDDCFRHDPDGKLLVGALSGFDQDRLIQAEEEEVEAEAAEVALLDKAQRRHRR